MLIWDVVVTAGSGKKVWWSCKQCPDGHPHEWETSVKSRRGGTHCPFCSNRRACRHNSLATKAQSVAAQFSNKNEGSPNDYTFGSDKKVLWQCELGHEWVAPVKRRATRNNGCRTCYDLRRPSRVQHPVLTMSQHSMMQHWDWEQNTKAGLNPSHITCRSNKTAHWICSGCPEGHPRRWQAIVNNSFSGRGCPCCSGQKACICNSLQSLAPEVAAEWDYTKNKGTPHDFPIFSSARVWWWTDKRGSFQACIYSQTSTALRKQQLGS